jgi:hypothetical protein
VGAGFPSRWVRLGDGPLCPREHSRWAVGPAAPRWRLDDAIALDNDPDRAGEALGPDRASTIMHIVDLDAAAYGDYRIRDLIRRLDRGGSRPGPGGRAGSAPRGEGAAVCIEKRGLAHRDGHRRHREPDHGVGDRGREHPDQYRRLPRRPPRRGGRDQGVDREQRPVSWEEVLIEMSSAGAVAFLVAEAAP